MELEQQIKERLEVLKTERDRFVVQANQQVAAYSAVISELEHLLQPEPQETTDAG